VAARRPSATRRLAAHAAGNRMGRFALCFCCDPTVCELEIPPLYRPYLFFFFFFPLVITVCLTVAGMGFSAKPNLKPPIAQGNYSLAAGFSA